MRRGQVSRVGPELPGQLRRLSYLPRQSRERPVSRMSADGRPYRVVRRNGEWFVEFTQNGSRRGGPWT